MPIVKCPSCLRETEFTGNEFRPFCSERCKLLDFGAWADEEFRLPTRETSLSEEDLDKIEKALNEKEKSKNKFSAQQADAVLNRKFHSKLRGIKPVRND